MCRLTFLQNFHTNITLVSPVVVAACHYGADMENQARFGLQRKGGFGTDDDGRLKAMCDRFFLCKKGA